MKISNNRSIIPSKNRVMLFNIASTVILQGLSFISGPIFSGVLGTDNYGIAAVYLTWVQIMSTTFSLQAFGTVALARVNFPMEDQEKYQSSVLSLSTFSFLGFSLLTIMIAYVVKRWFEINLIMIVLGLVHAWGLYCVTAINSKFTYEFSADKNFTLSVMTSVLTIVTSLLLIYIYPSEINYWGRIVGQSSVYACIGLFLFFYMLRHGRTIYNKQYWKFTLPLAIPTVFHLLAGIVLNQSDKVMLQVLIGNSAAGIYALACTFGAVLNILWNAFNNSWVPYYYEYMRSNQIDKIKKHARNYMELFTIITVGFILMAREVFHIYAAQSFWGGTDLIPILSIGYYFIFLYSFPVNYEFYNKKTKTIAIGTCVAAVCNIVLNYYLIKLEGIQGAVVATAVSHGLQFVFHLFFAKRICHRQFPFKWLDFIPGLIVVCFTCIIYWFTKELWIIRWFIAATLGAYITTKIIKRKEIF